MDINRLGCGPNRLEPSLNVGCLVRLLISGNPHFSWQALSFHTFMTRHPNQHMTSVVVIAFDAILNNFSAVILTTVFYCTPCKHRSMLPQFKVGAPHIQTLKPASPGQGRVLRNHQSTTQCPDDYAFVSRHPIPLWEL